MPVAICSHTKRAQKQLRECFAEQRASGTFESSGEDKRARTKHMAHKPPGCRAWSVSREAACYVCGILPAPPRGGGGVTMASSPSPATGLAHAAATGVSAAAVVVLTEVLPQPVAADATAAAPPPPPPLKPLPLSESPFAFTSLLGAVLLLAIIGGYLDAVFFLTVGVFVGLQTGNVIQIACAVVSPSGDRLAELRLAALAAWVVGLLAASAPPAARP